MNDPRSGCGAGARRAPVAGKKVPDQAYASSPTLEPFQRLIARVTRLDETRESWWRVAGAVGAPTPQTDYHAALKRLADLMVQGIVPDDLKDDLR